MHMSGEVRNQAMLATSSEGSEEISSSTATVVNTSDGRSNNKDNLPKTALVSTLSTEEATSSSASSVFIQSSDVRPGDVLCLRGTHHHPGNHRFRALVKPRQEEYAKAKKWDKTKIAQGILDEFYSVDSDPNSVPPGRFLQPVKEGQTQELWKKLDHDAILDKVKMALRLKPKNRKRPKTKKEAPMSASTGNLNVAVVETTRAPVSAAEVHTSQPNHTIYTEANGTETDTKHPPSCLASLDREAAFPVNSTTADTAQPLAETIRPPKVISASEENTPLLYPNEVSSPTEFEANGTGIEATKISRIVTTNVLEELLEERRTSPNLISAGAEEDTLQIEPIDIFHPTDGADMEATTNADIDILIAPQKPITTPMAISVEERMSQLDPIDIFSPIDIETLTGMEKLSSSSAKFNLDASAVHEDDIPEDPNKLLSEGHSISVEASQEADPTPMTNDTEGRYRQVDQQGVCRDPLLMLSVEAALQLCKNVRIMHDAAGSSVNVDNDLHTLGRALYQHFSGRAFPCDDFGSSRVSESAVVTSEISDSGERSTKRRGTQTTGGEIVDDTTSRAVSSVLMDLGLPVSLSILVASLLDARCDSAPDRYCSAAEAEEDLIRMVTHPDKYLFDAPVTSGGTQLEFSMNRLYGREHQSERLAEVVERVLSTKIKNRELVLIAGKSGTGKTTLVDALRAPWAERRGQFVSCKFDPQGHEQPMSAIFRAFDEYCKSLLEGDEAIRADVGSALRQALGSSADVLKELVPHLGPIVGGWDSASPVIQHVDSETFNRILFCFRSFVRTIAGPTHPVMVLFDDLHFADKASIDLINMLVTDMETRSLLFVGCYRDNEVGMDHPLTAFFGAVGRAAVPMSTISLSNLDENSLNDFLSDTLHVSPRLTRSLAESLHTKTGGNPLFVVELLKSFCDEGLVHFSASARRWNWNIDVIREKDIPDFALNLVLDRMRNYGPEIQWVLRVASCLGSRFDAEIMQVLYRNDSVGESSTITDQLGQLVADGLLVLVDSTYKFAHDQIWQAAYSLTPVEQREETHLQVGRQLLARLFSPDEIDRMLFTVVDQLNRGSSLVTDHDEKLRVAKLNLMAGEKASSASLFLQASIYLLEGTVLIEDRDWESHYDLCLNLFTSCAEAQLATGATGISVTLAPIFRHARRLEDSFRANLVLLDTLGNDDKALDAVKHGLVCAAQIGEIFPESIDHDLIMKEIGKTQTMIQRQSVSSILRKDLMTDEVKLYAMTLLEKLHMFAYFSRQELVPMLGCRMIQLSLSHGLCLESGSGFGILGLAMCRSPQSVEKAYEYGKLALALAGKMNDRKLHVQLVLVYGLINVLKEPVQACVEKYKEAFESSVSAGDLINACACSALYAAAAFQCGYQLESFIMQGRSYMLQLRNFSQQFLDPIITIYVQAALNLTGPCNDPTYLSVEAIDQDGSPNSATESQVHSFTSHLYLMRMWLAYLFGQYQIAADMIKERRNVLGRLAIRSQVIVNESFYSSLIASAMAREDRDSRWKEVAKEELEKVRSWSTNSSWNFQHKVELLTAEIAWLDGDLEAASRSYDTAVQTAERHHFVNEQGLACERAGLFMSDTISPDAAKAYFSRAHRCYVEWGAKVKADDVMSRYLS